jgi:hypothetical protein
MEASHLWLGWARVEGARYLKPLGARRDIGNVVPRYRVYV